MNQKTEAYNKGGLTFQIRPNTSDIKGVDEVMSGGYRRTRPFTFDVEAGETWLDLGSMVGAFSAYAVARGAKHVTAVEPDPDHIRLIQMNTPREKIEIVHAAVVADGMPPTMTLNRNDKRGNTWRNSIMRKWQGGTTIEVPTVHIKSLLPLSEDICIKMDIEGAEMPILEWLLAHPAQMKQVKKLAFEWSFDVDADLSRFRRVMSALIAEFPNVAPQKMYEGESEWPKSWFPACTTIFCSRV